MARLEPYLKRTGGDIPKSLELYCWHAELASDVHFVLGMTEVFVRNAMDRQLQAWNRKQDPEATSWLLEDPAPPLDKLSASKRSQALNWANKESKQKPKAHSRKDQPSHDDVLSCVMFGMCGGSSSASWDNHAVRFGRHGGREASSHIVETVSDSRFSK